MTVTGQSTPPLANSLSRAIIGLAAAMSLLTLVAMPVVGTAFAFRQTQPLIQLPWVLPVAAAFMILSSLVISTLLAGRYLSMGGSWVLWSGAVFLAVAVLGAFYLLSWPGLVGDHGLIGHSANTSGWLFVMTFSTLTALLLSVNAPPKANVAAATRISSVYGVAAAIAALAGLGSVSFENALPVVVAGLNFTPLAQILDTLISALLAVGAVSAYRRHHESRDPILGYVSLFLLLVAFGVFFTVIGGKRYDAWWYGARAVWDLAYVMLLLALVRESYSLFIRQRDLTVERERLLATMRDQSQQLQAQNEVLQSQSEELQSRSAELRAQYQELHANRDELRESQAKLEVALESMTDAVFISDTDGRFVDFNEAFATFHKFKNKAECAKTLAEYPEFLELFTDTGELAPLDTWPVRRALRGETATNAEYALRRKGTGETWVGSYSFAPIRDQEGRIVGSVVVARDVTEQKRAEQALRESEERLRTMADAIPQLAWMAKPDGFIYWYNRRWYEYTGTTPEQMEGWGWQSVHDPEMLPAVLERWMGSIATGEPFDMDFPLKGADGRFRWFLTRVMPLKDRDGRVLSWFGTNTDVTARKEAEEERMRLLADAQQARAEAEDAVKARDEFMAVAAHELKTPVTSLQGYAQVMVRQFEKTGSFDPARLARSLRTLDAQSKRLARLAEQLLNLSRLEAGKLKLSQEDTDLTALARGVVSVVQHSHPGRAIELRDQPVAHVSGDPLRLEQVLTNLLDNAIKFSNYDSVIEVEVYPAADGWVEIAVRDRGIGIPDGADELIFERFHQAHPTLQAGGMGIGLFVSRQIVEMHGGSLSLQRPPDGGARFVLRLPCR